MYRRLFIDGAVGKERLINRNQQSLCEMKRPPPLQKMCNICVKIMKMYMKSPTNHQVAFSHSRCLLII